MITYSYKLKTIWLDNRNRKQKAIISEGTISTYNEDTDENEIISLIKLKDLENSNRLKELAIKEITHSDIKFISCHLVKK